MGTHADTTAHILPMASGAAPCYVLVCFSIPSWGSLKSTNVYSSGYNSGFKKIFSSIILNFDSCIYAWRTRLELVSPQRIHGLQINISAGNAGFDKSGISGHGTGVRLVGRNVEVQIIPKCRIYTLGVLSPFSVPLKEEYVVFES